MNELIRGAYLEIPQCIAKQTKFYCYSKDASDNKHIKTFRVRRKQQLKIYQHKVLLDFVMLHKNKQSLNSIANRTYIENFGVTISHQTLYNYVDNPIMLEINRSWLTRSKKQHYRLKFKGKRVNGTSIEERPKFITSRDEFGH
jgi:IS30 family transposase